MIKRLIFNETPSIIITLDYEISGDGSGDIRELIINPTERLLDILNRRKLKMTVFFELEEFMVFKKYARALTKLLDYNPVLLIEEQLKKIICTGHEIGLHLHPQWIGASFDGKRFKLYPKNQCLFDIYQSENQMFSYFTERVNILKALVKKHDPSYEIECFRAGGLALRHEKLTLKAISSLGIKADSSVVKGLYRKGKRINLDYRDAPNDRGYWSVNDNVCKPEKEGKIIEFPIYSRMKPEYKKLSINRIKRKFLSPLQHLTSKSQALSNMNLPKTPWGMIKYLVSKSPVKYDFCHMTSQEMLKYLYDAKKEKGKSNNYPLTMIGHSKEFFNDKHFISFLDVAISDKQVKFMSMGEAARIIF